MHNVTRRTGRVFTRLAILCLLILVLLGTGASASAAGAEEEAIRSAALSYLQNYQETAMLYEDRDLRANTVADPSLALPEGTENAVFRINKKDVTLAQLRKNITYLEKKAAYYAGMRQLQGICREDLRLHCRLEELEIEGNTCRVYIDCTMEFQYTDSDRPSVYDCGYSIRLVKLGGRWLVADLTGEGSQLDKTYKESGTMDVEAALEVFAKQLETENCTLVFSARTPTSGNWIEYSGADAAAYAYTYSRRTAGETRADVYNWQFYCYAGQGGDCQNFVSQCMWAGFGGNQNSTAVSDHSLPMDNVGDSQWFGRPASGGKINLSWISCQSFRQYLTGSRDGAGSGGSNAAGDAGMYASVLDVGTGSAISAVTAEELVGAAAHVDGSGGLYSHAIIFTAATGTSRSEIWFCGHTSDMTNIKLGDFYTGPIKVYIPRYLRTGGAAGSLRAERLAPVAVGETGTLTARANGAQRQMTITVTPPGGVAKQAAVSDNTDTCQAEYLFELPGLYRVDCRARIASAMPVVTTFYVRCYVPEEPVSDAADVPPEEGEEAVESPDQTLQPEDKPAEEEPPEEPAQPEPEAVPEDMPFDEDIPGWLLQR